MIKFRILKRFLPALLFSVCVSVPVTVRAQAGTVVLEHMLDVSFIPEEGYFLVDFSTSQLHKVRGVLVPPFKLEERADRSGKWMIGGFVNVPAGAESLKFSVVIKGQDGQFAFLPNVEWSLESHDSFGGSSEKLQTHLNQRKEVLKSWMVQVRSQEDSLRRLRADADLIANVGRIVEVLEEAEAKKYEIENLEKDIAYLKDLFNQAKDQSVPKNFNRREIELTKQVAELAQVAKNAETGETARRYESQADLLRKISIVEATRFDDEERLKARLAVLRERRKQLERSGAVEKPSEAGNYWESQ